MKQCPEAATSGLFSGSVFVQRFPVIIFCLFLLSCLLAPAKPPEELLKNIRELEETTFAAEKEARYFENEGFVPLWNKLLATPRGQRMAVMANLSFDRLTLGKLNREVRQELGIQLGELIPGGPVLNPAEWKKWVGRFEKNGLEITHSDWHQDAFHRDEDGQAISKIRFTIHLERSQGRDRTELKAVVEVRWDETGETVRPAEIRLLSGRLARRIGPKAFEAVAVIEGETDQPDQRDDMGAISVFDLNSDELPEIILGNANRIFWNRGGMKFEAAPLIPENGEVHSSVVGVIGDFNGDGRLDWLCDSARAHLMLYPGTESGGFAARPRPIKLAIPLRVPSCLTAGDIDRDGDLDLFAGQWRSLYEKMPAQFWNANDGFGNRFYLGRENGRLAEAPFRDQVARTGWAWGSTSFDFDNDGDQDLYVGNGHISGKSTRDYCSNFWCRDIYLLRDQKAPVISSYLNSLSTLATESWDGYQVNSLLVNRGGQGFSSSAFMLDVGFDFDTRRVLSADLDLDGRPDLLVGRQESTSGFFHDAASETTPPALIVLKNTLPEAAQRNWIRVTLQGAPGISTHGAVVELQTREQTQRAVILSGDSFMCQHPAQKHFGLGTKDLVRQIKVTWPNGQTSLLKNPESNLGHLVKAKDLQGP